MEEYTHSLCEGIQNVEWSRNSGWRTNFTYLIPYITGTICEPLKGREFYCDSCLVFNEYRVTFLYIYRA